MAPAATATPAPAPAPADAVDRAAAAAAGEEAAPGGNAGGAAAGGRTGSEVRDRSLPGTCDPACFQMAGRVSPPLLHRRVGFTSPSFPADLMSVFHIRLSGAGGSLPVPWSVIAVSGVASSGAQTGHAASSPRVGRVTRRARVRAV